MESSDFGVRQVQGKSVPECALSLYSALLRFLPSVKFRIVTLTEDFAPVNNKVNSIEVEAGKAPRSLSQFCLLCQPHAVEAETVLMSAAPERATPTFYYIKLEEQRPLADGSAVALTGRLLSGGRVGAARGIRGSRQCSLLAELVRGNLRAACACVPAHPRPAPSTPAKKKTWQGFWGPLWAAGCGHRYQTSCVQTGS